jgi:poly-gamma-glutamate capsule biosynthesis protein CapA/YwtB (metallophosphatase superfamily)
VSSGTVTLLGCGDVGPIHERQESYTELVRNTLRSADIRFAQVERVYSRRGSLQLHSGGTHSRLNPQMASIFEECGFNALSLASNHAMDWGDDALLDTLELFAKMGIQTVGAGRNLEEARRPLVMEANGLKVGILAYCSILKDGYAAGPDKVGVAPLRIHTYYESHDSQPGVTPHVVTIPHKDDLAALIDGIAALRKTVDYVVVSLHWGIHYIPRLIADYQRDVARSVFAAGADLILGHHAHVPKAIEAKGDQICFYSLSNFIMSSKPKAGERGKAFERHYGVKLDPDYPNLAYGVDSKRSLIAKASLSKTGHRVSFLPVIIDKQLRPEILRNGDPRFDEMVRYMDWASEDYEHAFRVEGDEVVVTGAPSPTPANR